MTGHQLDVGLINSSGIINIIYIAVLSSIYLVIASNTHLYQMSSIT